MKSWLLSAALVWTAGHAAGSRDALLTRNPTTGTSPVTLFETSSRMTAAAGIEARLTRYVTRRVALEGFARWSRPALRTIISNDFESATGNESELQTTSLVSGGSILFRLSDSGLRPFIFAGAGAARQTEEGSDAAVTGTELHAGGGIDRPFRRRLSLRADAAVSSLSKTPSFDAKRKTLLVASIGVGYRF